MQLVRRLRGWIAAFRERRRARAIARLTDGRTNQRDTYVPDPGALIRDRSERR
jgi:hypothetical protein